MVVPAAGHRFAEALAAARGSMIQGHTAETNGSSPGRRGKQLWIHAGAVACSGLHWPSGPAKPSSSPSLTLAHPCSMPATRPSTWSIGSTRPNPSSLPYKPDLNALTSQPEFRAVVGPVIGNKHDAIRKMGNRAVHDKQVPSPLAARQAVSELFHVCYWLARTYTVHDSALPPERLQFNAELLAPRLKPGIPAPKPQSAEQVSKLDAELAASDKALAAARAESADLQRQSLRSRSKSRRPRNATRPSPTTTITTSP